MNSNFAKFPYIEEEISVIRESEVTAKKDYIVQEFPLTIFLNGEELVTLLCTPEKMDYLALGFLCSEGFVRDRSDIAGIRLIVDRGLVEVETAHSFSFGEKTFGRRTITTGCGRGTTFYSAWDSLRSAPVFSDLQVSPDDILVLMRNLQDRSTIFRDTGGVHSAALCAKDKILYFCEDVGRHNAIDKIVGQCLWEDITVAEKILLSSGRLSSEMLIKAAKLGIPILVSRSAPTSLCLEMAREVNITVVGFVRGQRMNVYTAPERIILAACGGAVGKIKKT